jgi:hypothetical protein
MGNCAKKVSRRLNILCKEDVELDGSSREVSPKAKQTRGLSHKVDQEMRSLGAGDMIYGKQKQQESNRSPHLLHRCLTSQQGGTTDRRIHQNCAIGHLQSKSSKLGQRHDLLGSYSRMGERMKAVGTAQVTTWGPGMRPLPRCHNASRC